MALLFNSFASSDDALVGFNSKPFQSESFPENSFDCKDRVHSLMKLAGTASLAVQDGYSIPTVID